MTIRIRDGGEADVDGIARVHVQGWRESYAEFLTPEALAGLSVEERTRMWREGLAETDPRRLALVGRTGEGEIVCFSADGPVCSNGTDSLGTDGEIYAIYLLDKVKRRALMAGLFSHLARQGFASAGLWVLKDNEAARSFYKTLGGQAGPEQELRGQTITEIVYRFEPIPILA